MSIALNRKSPTEPLINSESFSCAGKMRQIKAPIAGNSKSITKIGNAELVHFNQQMLIHELIRGSVINNLINYPLLGRAALIYFLDDFISDISRTRLIVLEFHRKLSTTRGHGT